jgi:hypothetical protein
MKKQKQVLSNEKDREIQEEMGCCRYFTGIQNETCKAGINVRQLVGGSDLGWARRMPCFLRDVGTCEVNCEKRKFPTREEAEKSVTESDALLEEVLSAVVLAQADAKKKGLGIGNGGSGSVICPRCAGILRYSIAGLNGHLWGKCATVDCLSWMQ